MSDEEIIDALVEADMAEWNKHRREIRREFGPTARNRKRAAWIEQFGIAHRPKAEQSLEDNWNLIWELLCGDQDLITSFDKPRIYTKRDGRPKRCCRICSLMWEAGYR